EGTPFGKPCTASSPLTRQFIRHNGDSTMPGPAIQSSALELIGNTPLLEVRCFDVGACRLFVKLENQNPGGSIKDRMALSMITAAEQAGTLQPGGVIVEATAGNTGLG